ncbi:related to multidrug resistant protein [Ramularia collo-cygni]|uniref:Related to multidrug resistant protein n=1 Tax=Ramularia collo-cygni TaxID=112498 RepID=A0A2D3V6P5_9PEZI|nr:related to multidrug resistant protein [Ramularia collo-cygni]CZT17159.1 related to multidrug resistant protein [Ramularia collo-cygni]
MHTVGIPAHVHDALEKRGFQANGSGEVTWLENSKSHPRQWSLTRKIGDTAVICVLEFLTTLMSNAGSSITSDVGMKIGAGREVALLCLVTSYLAGQGLGSLIFPPIAEVFGGRTIYVASTFGYAVTCLIIAACPNLVVVVIFRFLGGFCSAIPTVVAASSIENMWDSTARVWVIHIWIASAVLGLGIGPPVATYAALSPYGWRSLFYAAAAVLAVVALLCLGMQESRPSKVLRNQVKTVARKTNFDRLSVTELDSSPDVNTFIKTTLALPIRLFFTEPIVFFTSTMAAMVYGLTYLFTEAFSIIYTDHFGLPRQESSLVFLSIAVGVLFTFLPRIYDVKLLKRRASRNTPMEAEDKLFGFYVAAPVLAIGLWWCAFTVPPLAEGISVWPSIISLLLFGYAVVEFDNTLCGYLCDTYVQYSASANAPLAVLRAILSGAFPLYGAQMFKGLGPNNALFLLAAMATAFCGVAAMFFFYGKRIRQRSPFAEKTWEGAQNTERPEEPPKHQC